MKSYLALLTILALSAFFVLESIDKVHAMRVAPPKPLGCPMMAKLCPDGSHVSPVGSNCEMPPCPGEKAKPPAPPVACPMVAKKCPDGSYVSASGPKCEFICPGDDGSSSETDSDDIFTKNGFAPDNKKGAEPQKRGIDPNDDSDDSSDCEGKNGCAD
jgi:hypothetical protein